MAMLTITKLSIIRTKHKSSEYTYNEKEASSILGASRSQEAVRLRRDSLNSVSIRCVVVSSMQSAAKIFTSLRKRDQIKMLINNLVIKVR